MVAVTVLGLAGTGALAQEAAATPSITFSGEGGMGVKYSGTISDNAETTAVNEKRESRIKFVSDFDVAMTATGTTDGGLTFGATAKIKAGNAASTVGASQVYIGGESWKITIGDLDPASHMGRSIGDVGYDGLGVDNVAEEIGGYLGTAADAEVSFNLGTASLKVTVGDDRSHITPFVVNTTPAITPASSRELLTRDAVAKKQKTAWATGVSFDIGSTSLGIGMDSEKLMQAGLSADLGAFGGKLFFSQQKVDGPVDLGADGAKGGTDDNADVMHENKRTGIGVEISVSAGANTTINAVYAQGKQSDVRAFDTAANHLVVPGNMAAGDADEATNPVGKTDKGFGVGISHDLGGGATLAAGFGKVKKRTMASVGVTMKF